MLTDALVNFYLIDFVNPNELLTGVDSTGALGRHGGDVQSDAGGRPDAD